MIDTSIAPDRRPVATRTVWVAAIAAAAVIGAIIEYIRTGALGETLEALVAGGLAGAVAAFALSLPGVRWRGTAIGAFFVGATILSTTFLDRPLVVWSMLLVAGLLFAFWSRPWLPNLRGSLGMGSAWLGTSYWILGMLGALAVGQFVVGAQRLAYAGALGLAVLAVLACVRRGDRFRDLSAGIVVAFLFALALLLLAGSGAVFDTFRPLPSGAWGISPVQRRFWGGEWLLYHPNSMAGIAVAAAIRFGPDRAYAVWQRLAAAGVAGLFVYLTQSRSSFLFLGAAGAVHAGLLWWRRRRPVESLPEYGTPARTWAAAAVPFVVLGLILIVSGGKGFLFAQRYDAGDVTSGRTDTWAAVIRDFRGDSVAEKLLGNADHARGVVIREETAERPEDRPKLPTDNAAFGALRRGGVVGVLAFLVGLVLLVRHAVRREAPAWFMIGAVAALPTIATTDWLLGGTGGTLWILLVAGEALVLARRSPQGAADPAP